jgi:hypothetical protein
MDILMADLVNGLRTTGTRIEPIREVQDQSIGCADICVAVDHTGRNGDEYRAGLAHEVVLPEARLAVAVFPERQAELSEQEAESIGLVFVLMRTAHNARMGQTDVGHGGREARGELVASVELGKPAACVTPEKEGQEEDAGYS